MKSLYVLRKVFSLALCSALMTPQPVRAARGDIAQSQATPIPKPGQTKSSPPAAKGSDQSAQSGISSSGATAGSDKTDQGKAARDEAVAQFEATLAGIFDPEKDNSDYVPCFFTKSQLLALRPSPPAPRLTGEQAEDLASAVLAQVLSPAGQKAFSGAVRDKIVTTLKEADLEDLTPSAALGQVIAILQNAETAVPEYAKAATDSSGNPIGPDTAAKLIDATVHYADTESVTEGLSLDASAARDEKLRQYRSYLATQNLANLTGPEALSKISSATASWLKDQNSEVAASESTTSQVESALNALSASASATQTANGESGADLLKKVVGNAKSSSSPDFVATDAFNEVLQNYQEVLSEKVKNQNGDQAASTVASSTSAFVQQKKQSMTQKASTTVGQQEALKGVDAGGNAAKEATVNNSAANAAIVNGARSLLSSFKRPVDIACAMSVLSWSETRYAFGRLIANEYIGIQVIVRNINDKQEFLLQDAAVGVDSDLTGRKGRYFSGRDRIIVRALTVAQKDDSPRNIFMNVLSGVGTLLTTVVPFADVTNLADAASAWNGALVPGIGKAWTDNTTDQIKLLDDIGFSSAMNQKTVVPKSGTVMFVMFVPSKPFQQGWWTQPCAETISSGVLFNPPTSPPSRPVDSDKKVGLELDQAYVNCHNPQNPWTLEQATTDYPTSRGPQTYQRFKAVPYKKWSPNADAIFEELAFSVVSGIHIQESSQTKPALTAVNCQEDKLGNVDFNKQANGAVSCDVTGQNLDQVPTLRLRNAQNPLDSKTAEGSVTVSGDSTAAKASFPLAQIGPLDQPAYKVYPVTKDSVEGAAGPTLHFALTAFVYPAEQSFDLSKLNGNGDVPITGFHLDHVTQLQFAKDSEGPQATDVDVKTPAEAQLTFSFKPSATLIADSTKSPSTSVTVKATLITSDKTQPDPPPTVTFKITKSATTQNATKSGPAVTLNEKTLDFGKQTLGVPSKSKSLTIKNSGTAPLTISAVALAGVQKDDFKVSGSCGSVAAGKQCTVNVTFTPTAEGARKASLSLKDNASDSPQTATVTGTGEKAAQ